MYCMISSGPCLESSKIRLRTDASCKYAVRYCIRRLSVAEEIERYFRLRVVHHQDYQVIDPFAGRVRPTKKGHIHRLKKLRLKVYF